MKIAMALVLEIDAGQLAQRLGHQPGLQAHMAIAHIALDFGPGHQRGHRVDHHDVDGARAEQRLRRFPAPARRYPAGKHSRISDIDAQGPCAYTGSSACSASMNAAVAAHVAAPAAISVQGDEWFCRMPPARKFRRCGRGASRPRPAQNPERMAAGGDDSPRSFCAYLTKAHHRALAKALFNSAAGPFPANAFFRRQIFAGRWSLSACRLPFCSLQTKVYRTYILPHFPRNCHRTAH